MYKNKVVFLALASLSFFTTCSTVKAPKGQVPRRVDLASDAFGGWMMLTLSTNQKVEGELVAVTTDSIYVLNQELSSLSKTSIVDGRLVMYNTDTGRFARWTFVGGVGTITNGIFLIFTLPVWLITGISTTVTESNRINYLDSPQTDWTDLKKYARFPQGFPPGLDKRTLEPRPVK